MCICRFILIDSQFADNKTGFDKFIYFSQFVSNTSIILELQIRKYCYTIKLLYILNIEFNQYRFYFPYIMVYLIDHNFFYIRHYR